MNRSQLAINTVSIRDAGFEELLAACADAGFGKVEFSLAQVKSYIAEGHSPGDVKRLLESQGLACIGGFETGVLCFAGGAERDANHALVTENARLIGELGGTNMVVGTDGPGAPMAPDEVMGRIAATFGELAAKIEPTGVGFSIEFNWSPVVKSLRTAAEIARRSGARNVGVVFDPAHYHCTQTKFDQLTSATVACIRHVHVDDMRDLPGEMSNCNSDRVLPGEGCLDLRAIFGRLEELGYPGDFAIEMFNEELWSKPPAEAAKLMYESLLPYCEGE